MKIYVNDELVYDSEFFGTEIEKINIQYKTEDKGR